MKGRSSVVPQQEAGLVEAEFPAGGSGRQGFEGRLDHRVEGGVVGALEAQLAIEPLGGVEQFQVCIPHGADHELGHHAGPQAFPGPELADPLKALHQLGPEVLLGGHRSQTLFRGALQVDGDPVGQLHGPADLVILCAGHDFEVDVAPVAVATPDDFHRVQEAILGGDAAFDDARGEEETIHQASPFHLDEGCGHFVWREGEAPGSISAGTERTVVAISFTGRSEHGLEHRFFAHGGGDVGDAWQGLGRPAGGSLFHRLAAGRLKAGGIPQQGKFLVGVRCDLEVHAFSI